MNTSVKLVFKGGEYFLLELRASIFRGSLLMKSGLTSFPLSRDSFLPLAWGHRGLLAFLLGLLFQHLSLQECPNQFFLVDKLLGQLHKLGQSNHLSIPA
jgi:hypothetical protein